MNAFTLFMSLAIAAAVVYVVFSMLIVHELQKRNVKINFILLRLFLFEYMNQYKEMTKRETGKVGPLFYGAIVSINAALVFVILGLLLR